MSTLIGLASIGGPPLGGILTETIGWRWCFRINPPPGILMLLAGAYFLEDADSDRAVKYGSPLARLKSFDWLGVATCLTAVICLLLGLQLAALSENWLDARVMGLFSVTAFLVGLFVYIQHRLGEKGILPLRLLRQRSIAAGAVYTFTMGPAVTTVLFYVCFLPLFKLMCVLIMI